MYPCSFFDQISQDTGKFVFGVKDTLTCLDMGAVETLIVWENLDMQRYVFTNSTTGRPTARYGQADAGRGRRGGADWGARGGQRGRSRADNSTRYYGAPGRHPSIRCWKPCPTHPSHGALPHPPAAGVQEIKFLGKEQETESKHFKDPATNLDLEVTDKV